MESHLPGRTVLSLLVRHEAPDGVFHLADFHLRDAIALAEVEHLAWVDEGLIPGQFVPRRHPLLPFWDAPLRIGTDQHREGVAHVSTSRCRTFEALAGSFTATVAPSAPPSRRRPASPRRSANGPPE